MSKPQKQGELDAKTKFLKYCKQLDGIGADESIQSPKMAVLRAKALKLMKELIKERVDHSQNLKAFWYAGYYRPYRDFVVQNNGDVEIVTLLTMFSGELSELINSKYDAQLYMYIGDLHRYMPKDEIQRSLAETYYTKSIECDPRVGKVYYNLYTFREDASFAEKLMLLLMSQKAEIAYDSGAKLADTLRFVELTEGDDFVSDKVLAQFVRWALLDRTSKADHQNGGSTIMKVFKETLEKQPDSDWPMVLCACRLALEIAVKTHGFDRFLTCFDVLTNFHLGVVAKNPKNMRLLTESISWIVTVSKIFNALNDKNETNMKTLSNFTKTKWDELNDVIMEQINTVFEPQEALTFSSFTPEIIEKLMFPKHDPSLKVFKKFVRMILDLPHPTMAVADGDDEPCLRRVNETKPKRLDVPAEHLVKTPTIEEEDWRPVYVIMDLHTVVDHMHKAVEIWELKDFICVITYHTFTQIDDMKKRVKKVRFILRKMDEGLETNLITRKHCKNEVECAKELVAGINRSEKDHAQIVAVLCEKPEENDPIEGVSFYTIHDFYKKLTS